MSCANKLVSGHSAASELALCGGPGESRVGERRLRTRRDSSPYELWGPTRYIEAVVDTGHSGFLILPPGLVEELGLPFAYMGQEFPADRAELNLDVHYTAVLWHD